MFLLFQFLADGNSLQQPINVKDLAKFIVDVWIIESLLRMILIYLENIL